MQRRHVLPILIGAALFVLAIPARAQSQDQLFTATKNQLAATKVVLAQQTAWNKGDLDGYVSHYKDAADTVALLAGPVRGLSNIRSAFHINFPSRDSMGELEETEVEARELGENYVLVTGRYTLDRPKKSGGRSEGTFSEIVEKTPAGWLVVFSQTS